MANTGNRARKIPGTQGNKSKGLVMNDVISSDYSPSVLKVISIFYSCDGTRSFFVFHMVLY